MASKDFAILYVENPEASGRFYAGLLRREPVEASPGFVLFALESGLMLGLWSRHTVAPAAAGAPGAGELAFTLPDVAALDGRFADWQARGLTILQPPTDMEFGRSFVIADPDGHRIRAFVPT